MYVGIFMNDKASMVAALIPSSQSMGIAEGTTEFMEDYASAENS
jgi:hypothetical protein